MANEWMQYKKEIIQLVLWYVILALQLYSLISIIITPDLITTDCTECDYYSKSFALACPPDTTDVFCTRLNCQNGCAVYATNEDSGIYVTNKYSGVCEIYKCGKDSYLAFIGFIILQIIGIILILIMTYDAQRILNNLLNRPIANSPNELPAGVPADISLNNLQSNASNDSNASNASNDSNESEEEQNLLSNSLDKSEEEKLQLKVETV